MQSHDHHNDVTYIYILNLLLVCFRSHFVTFGIATNHFENKLKKMRSSSFNAFQIFCLLSMNSLHSGMIFYKLETISVAFSYWYRVVCKEWIAVINVNIYFHPSVVIIWNSFFDFHWNWFSFFYGFFFQFLLLSNANIMTDDWFYRMDFNFGDFRWDIVLNEMKKPEGSVEE